MADNITYIPYGLDEISQLDLLTALANDLPNFVSLYKWLLKPKNLEKFLKAYDDIMKGFTGATNEGGRWKINTNTVIDTASMSPKDREIYEHAAYYIQLQMAKMTPKAKAEETKKENLDKFNFLESFGKQLLNLYGGNPEIFRNSEQGWNSLDARGADGFRGTKERRRVMAELLKLYKLDLEGKDYNFEGTSFKDKQDALNKLLTAIDALGTDEETDDLPAFSALGLNYRNFFSNGGNEELILEDGRKTTYLEYNQAQKKKLEDEAKAKAELAKLQRANQYDGYKYFNVLNGTPLNQDSATAIITKLKNNLQLDGNDISGLSWIFKNAMKMGGLENLSKEELAKMPRYAGTPTRLKKISGVEGIYYDTVGNKFIRPYKNTQLSGVTLQAILDLNSPSKIAELKLLANLKAMNTPINWSDIDEVTSNELWAVANDIGAFVDPEAISGTVMALNAARLRDKNRGEGWNWERILDWGTSALGGLPIIGDAMSAYKAGSNLVKIANASARVGSLVAAAFSAANVPEAWDSIKKIVSKGPTSMTTLDIRNITYGLMGFAAGWKTINSINARSKPQTTKEKSIKIDNKKIVLDEPTVQKVETIHKLSKNTKEASDNIIKMQEVRDAAKKAGIEVTDASKVTSGSGILRGNRYSKSLGLSKSPIQTNTVETGNIIPSSSNVYWMPRTRRNFLNEYSNTLETPKNPLRKGLDWFMGRTSEVKSAETPKTNSTETPKTIKTSEPKSIEISKQSKERIKKYNEYVDKRIKDLDEGKFSKNKLKSGDLDISGHRLQVVEQSDGTFNLIYKGNILGNFQKHELKKLQEAIREIINNRTIRIDPNTKVKTIGTKEIGKILLELKRKGWLKQGGQINSSLDTIIEDFIKNNNI